MVTLYARGSLFWRHQASDVAHMVTGWVQFRLQIEVLLTWWDQRWRILTSWGAPGVQMWRKDSKY